MLPLPWPLDVSSAPSVDLQAAGGWEGWEHTWGLEVEADVHFLNGGMKTTVPQAPSHVRMDGECVQEAGWGPERFATGLA